MKASEHKAAETRRHEDEESEGTLAKATAEADLATERAKNEAGDRKLSEAEIQAIEEDALRRRFSTPQKEATSVPITLLSANQPPPVTFDEVMADLKFPAAKEDLVSRARNRGMLMEERYQLERMEDRLYVDMDQVKAAMRAAPL